MKLVQTAKLVIDCSPKEFQSTIKAYTEAFNFVCKTGFESKDTNGVSLHHKTYEECRKTLPSQLAISSRMKATESLKSVQAKIKSGKKVSCPQSKQASIRLDVNSYSLWLNKKIISVSTVDGRKKLPLIIPAYFERYLTWKDDVYCAWGDINETSVRIFVRADARDVAKHEVNNVMPNVSFYR